MSTINITNRELEKNGVKLTTSTQKIVRGDRKNTEYSIVSPVLVLQADGKTVDEAATAASIMNFAKWRGFKQTVKVLTSSELQDGQAALDYAGKFTPYDSVDEDGKPIKLEMLESVDIDKYYNAYVSDTMRGGESIKTLEEEFKSASLRMSQLFPSLATSPADKAAAIMAELTELGMEVQNLQQAIEARRRK